jgi:hypothetical protein
MPNVSNIVKTIQDIMRKDAGTYGDAQRLEQLGWMFFLKIFDDREKEMELVRDDYKSPLPKHLRWSTWATDEEGITGEALLDFINNTLLPKLKTLNGAGGPISTLIRTTFEDANNYMKNGTLMRQVINKINGIDFNASDDRHMFGDIYEKLLKDLQSAGNAGEFYTPRAVTQFIVEQVNPRLGESILDPACGTGGFLVCAIEHLRKQAKSKDDQQTIQDCFAGIEKKHLPHVLCITNLLLHGIDVPFNVRHTNTLAKPLISWGPKERVDVIVTNQPPKSQFSDKPKPGYVRMFQIRDLGERPVPIYISRESTNRFCREGEILIGRYGASVGKIFWAQEGAYNVALAKFIYPEDAFLPAFAFWLLKSEFFQAEIAGASRSAQAGFNKGDLASINFPLPPLAEQKRIVAKVNELMGLCDRLEAQQTEREQKHAALARASLSRFAEAPTAANLGFLFHHAYTIDGADLRKSILMLAVQGKLVAQDPEDDPASDLLSKIAEEKRRLVSAKVIRQQDDAPPIPEEEVAFVVPAGWEWARLSTITRRIHYGFTASARAELRDVRLLRITDIQNNSVDWAAVPGCEIAQEDVPQYQLERGDILVARTGGTVGKTYLVQEVPVTAVFASYLIRIQGSTLLFDRYLKLFLESPTYWVQLEEGARGAAQPNVNGQTLGRMVVCLPPLAEQRRIVAKVDQLMALVDQLEAQLAASRATAEKLTEAVVAELTTQK